MQRETQDKKSFTYLAPQSDLTRKTVVNNGSLWEAHWFYTKDHHRLEFWNAEESFLEIHRSPGQGLFLSAVTPPGFLTAKTVCF